MTVALRQIVLAKKTNIKVGQWYSGKVPKADFPMGRQAYGIGNSYRWCVISFSAIGFECRVLVVVNFQKQKFQAILGVMGTGMLHILCSYEFHATEPGWHCHAACDDVSLVPLGYMRGPWVRRTPGANRAHRSLNFAIEDERDAQRCAFDCYRIEAEGDLL